MTLLETIQAELDTDPAGDIARAIAEKLENGDMQLTGNFRGHEAEMVADYKECK